ncbi:MAG TPA: Fe-S cluster assembly protein SufD [Steroidobacteraceae bacterium]|jgi:Fe-S cluster assembly protein SufD|nr:Fe-S cluster assembly protein SufD [Steroidobacteraceae bacterium]
MNASAPIERIASLHARLAPSLGGGAAWARRRGEALGTLVARGLPDRRDENWKYLDHARLAEYPFDAAPHAPADAARLAHLLLPLERARRIVLADGRFNATLSSDLAAAGLEVVDLGRLLEREPEAALGLLRTPGADADDRYALLADAFASGGVLLRIAEGCRLDEPVYLVHLATAAEPAVHQSRVVIEAGAHAHCTLVEHFVTSGDSAVLGNLAADISLAESAAVAHLRLHQHAAAAAQVETWTARLAAKSRYEQHLMALGGRLLRSSLRLALEGAGSACRLDGLFLADGERQVDLLTQVAHVGAATETLQDYRGIAAGRGRGSFNGRITVQPTARGANASQSSRNLLLTPLAEINARPQLEILVDEVQCRHGATTGTLDPDQLFYLVSRGLDPAAARALLTYAFCRDLIGRVPVAAVRSAAESLVASSLPDRDLIRGLA